MASTQVVWWVLWKPRGLYTCVLPNAYHSNPIIDHYCEFLSPKLQNWEWDLMQINHSGPSVYPVRIPSTTTFLFLCYQPFPSWVPVHWISLHLVAASLPQTLQISVTAFMPTAIKCRDSYVDSTGYQWVQQTINCYGKTDEKAIISR
jgi:hypothetical protein